MKALIINMASQTQRMAFQEAQMAVLGLDYERLEATTPAGITPPAADPWWDGWERPLIDAEKAALLSHRSAWQRVAGEGQPMLVLEDDALLAAQVPSFVAQAGRLPGIDHITLEVRARAKLVARRGWPGLAARRLYQDRTGAAAYLLWPSGAEKLLARSRKRPAIADSVICANYKLTSLQADPALAIQIDLCEHYRLGAPIHTTTTIVPLRYALHDRGGFKHRLRRLHAQWRIAQRRVSRCAVATRREIAISTDWPEAIMPAEE